MSVVSGYREAVVQVVHAMVFVRDRASVKGRP